MQLKNLLVDEVWKKRISELIVRVGKGDERSLVLLYKETAPRLMSIALALLRSKQDAEDAVSETFVRVVRYAAGFKRRDNGYGWLATITRNCANDILKKRREHINIDEVFGLTGSGGIDETRSDITAALGGLSEEERELIVMRYYGDITVRDIAKEQGQPRSTVMNKLQRAEEKLRKILSPPGSM